VELINNHIEELRNLCEQYFVEELQVFGSVVKGNYNPESDIDFLVKFSGVEPLDYFDNYIDFKNALENLFNCKVDLVETQTLKNPILIKSINRDKVKLYGRKDSKMVV
jgi:predicted nucleotidyltransferase